MWRPGQHLHGLAQHLEAALPVAAVGLAVEEHPVQRGPQRQVVLGLWGDKGSGGRGVCTPGSPARGPSSRGVGWGGHCPCSTAAPTLTRGTARVPEIVASLPGWCTFPRCSRSSLFALNPHVPGSPPCRSPRPTWEEAPVRGPSDLEVRRRPLVHELRPPLLLERRNQQPAWGAPRRPPPTPRSIRLRIAEAPRRPAPTLRSIRLRISLQKEQLNGQNAESHPPPTNSLQRTVDVRRAHRPSASTAPAVTRASRFCSFKSMGPKAH